MFSVMFVTIQGHPPDMFKLVHYEEVHTVIKRTVDILLKYFLICILDNLKYYSYIIPI